MFSSYWILGKAR